MHLVKLQITDVCYNESNWQKLGLVSSYEVK